MMSGKENNDMQQDTENLAGIDLNSDENQTGTSHLNEPVAEESELEKLKTELEDAKDKYIRKVAEFDNFRRRTAKERIDLIQTAGKDVITDLLELIDDYERAQKQSAEAKDPAGVAEGLSLIFQKLKNKLHAQGLKAMETINTDFNPDLHEAITEIPAPSEALKGKVIDEVSKGYYLNDKIIRHAKVVVGK